MITRLQILLTNTILTLLEKVAVRTLFDLGSLKDGKIIVEKIIVSGFKPNTGPKLVFLRQV